MTLFFSSSTDNLALCCGVNGGFACPAPAWGLASQHCIEHPYSLWRSVFAVSLIVKNHLCCSNQLKHNEKPGRAATGSLVIYTWTGSRSDFEVELSFLKWHYCVSTTVNVACYCYLCTLIFWPNTTVHFCSCFPFQTAINKRTGNKVTPGSCRKSTDGAAQLSVSVWYKSYSMQKHSPLVFSPRLPLCHLKNAWRLWIN